MSFLRNQKRENWILDIDVAQRSAMRVKYEHYYHYRYHSLPDIRYIIFAELRL